MCDWTSIESSRKRSSDHRQVVDLEMVVPFDQTIGSEILLIDVRSPGEFQNGHLHGAINIPLFSDEEREIVGTIYKKNGKDEALKKGLDFVGPKMSSFIEKSKSKILNNSVYVYCFRGGMRSESFVWLLNIAGINAKKIDGGYKTARKYIREYFERPANIIILGGRTGSGKTDYLKSLGGKNVQIVDLEGLANHKGSAFGHINEKRQPTNEQFENDLFEIWAGLDLEKPVVLEDESVFIGKVRIPDPMYKQMQNVHVICLEVSFEERIMRLKRDYANTDIEELIESCHRIKKKLGDRRLGETVGFIKEGDYESACKILLEYYDKFYNYGLEVKRNPSTVYPLVLNGSVSDENVEILKEHVLRMGKIG